MYTLQSNSLMNYGQEKSGPRLLMEFSRNQQVPQLISVHEIAQKENNRLKLLQQARYQAPKKINPPEFARSRVDPLLEAERSENQELRLAVKQLTSQLQKLKEVNEGLIERLREVENSYRSLRGDFERSNEEDKKKLKSQIYADIQEYLKGAIQRLASTLKLEKMTPLLQDKLERFMAEIMEINQITVEYSVRKSKDQSRKKQSLLSGSGFNTQEFSQAERYLTEASRGRESQNREQYASIMQRLTGEPRLSKSIAVGGYGSNGRDQGMRHIYATTPQKRKRIFD